MNNPIYLDYNATTPIDGEVAAAMRPYLEQYFGNPSSTHSYGVHTRKAIEEARRQVAALLHCDTSEVIFTSGGTEANNWAIKGAAYQHRDKGNHIITTAIEHPAVSEVCRHLQGEGFQVTVLPVDAEGMVDPREIEKAITPATILISMMHANNEVGTIQPIEEISRIAKKHGVLLHSDGAQSTGKIPTDVKALGVDLFSVAGHKLYAPKGIGVLYVRQGVQIQKLIHGADHEQNRRAGTENVLEIVGLGKAAEIALRDMNLQQQRQQELRDRLYNLLKQELPDVRLNGHREQRLPNTLSLSFPGVEANTLLAELTGVAASAGAACHADNIDLSPVLTAMKIPIRFAMGTIRFSTGRFTSQNDIEKAAAEIIAAVKRLQPEKENRAEHVATDEVIKLTHFTHGLGCACKIRPQYLEKVLRDLPPVFDKNVLISADTSDDAAVYLIRPDVALVQTVDFFTPIVDDAYDFGAIAAANALSDIYAMGATPLFALNIVGFPDGRLPMQVLHDILRGAADKAAQAGISILGGHTVEDTEPKFGMVVTGVVHPDKVMRNSTALPGDVLVLTKPLGTGIIATAVKRGLANEAIADRARHHMLQLNATAARLMENFAVHACTDVTGFGLLGHLKEMVQGSKVKAILHAAAVPLIEGVMQMAQEGAIPGGTKNNLEYVAALTKWNDTISEITKLILCDAQTSGGLLIAVAAKDADALVATLREAGIAEAAAIGTIEAGAAEIVVN